MAVWQTFTLAEEKRPSLSDLWIPASWSEAQAVPSTPAQWHVIHTVSPMQKPLWLERGLFKCEALQNCSEQIKNYSTTNEPSALNSGSCTPEVPAARPCAIGFRPTVN